MIKNAIFKERERESVVKIYNGDNLEILNELTFDKNIVIVTDPPFNINYHYNEYNDKKDEGEYYTWLSDILSFSDKKVIIHYPEQQFKLSFEMGLFPNKIVSWVYNSNNSRQHRVAAYYGVHPQFNQVLQPYKNLNDKRIKQRIANGNLGAKSYDWFYINQIKNVSKEKTKHPAQMPIEVMKRIVGLLPKGSVILDPFMGSGTTGVACKELGYDFIGIELNEEYFKIAKERLND